MGVDDPLSGWSGEAADPADHPFDTSDRERYDRGNVLGWGGMGVVLAAEDRRLRREVAWKQGTDARLAQEAWIAAQLEHPGIVPVYDAGYDEQGRPFYTMRLIRGRTLATAIEEAPDLEARLRLLRHFLDVCHAMAYAHSVGVVHRDLKPANVMVGEFGETQIVDWGIATAIDQDQEEPAGASVPVGHRALTHDGAIVGTPAYMSPEQAAGAPADPRTDVWSLGATLRELLAGRPTADPLPAEVPAELRAIVERATADDPADRYPTAGGLARDVEAWLDGRRVGAHDYTPTEILIRFLRAWRVPLLATAATLLAVTLATGIALVRVRAARDAAEVARVETLAALAIADDRLGQALAARSVDAFVQGAVPEAELLAATALTVRESPRARGVLSGTVGARLERQSVQPGPCPRVQLDRTGRYAACVSGTLSVWDLHTNTELWSSDRAVDHVQIDAARGRLAVLSELDLSLLDLETGVAVHQRRVPGDAELVQSQGGKLVLRAFNEVLLVDLDTLEARGVPACEGSTTASASMGHGQLLVGCSDTSWELGPTAGPLQRMGALSTTPTTFAAWLAPDRVAMGFPGGQIHVLSVPDGQIVRSYREQGGRVQVLESADGKLVAGLDHRSPAVMTELWSTRFPSDVDRAVLHDGVLTTHGKRGLEVWRIPETPLIEGWSGSGVTSIDTWGPWVSATDGNGYATIRTAGGEPVTELRWQDKVVKAGMFSRDGRRFAGVGIGSPRIHLWDTGDWTEIPSDEGSYFVRVAPHGASGFMGLSYSPHLQIMDDQGHEVRIVEGRQFFDAGPSQTAVALLGPEVVLADPDPGTGFPFQEGLAIDLSEDGRLAIAHRRGISIRTASGEVLTELRTTDRIWDVAWSPDGRWIAAGTLSGTVQVWSVDREVLHALLPGHTERVSAVAFSPDGRWLYTGSWDATIRRWSTDAWTADPEAWVREAETAWGRSAEDALSARF